MLNNKISLRLFALIISVLNLLFFHFPFFQFVINSINYKSFNGILLIISLVFAMVIANAFVTYLLFGINRIFGKILFTPLFLINSVALYFVNTYSVIIDESMISNVFNTNTEESSSFFSFKMVLYVLFLGVLPSVFVLKAKIEKVSFKTFSKNSGIALALLVFFVLINASNLLWIDKNSKKLGGLAMPWCYVVNTCLYFKHEAKKNEKEILLPEARIVNNEKSVVVLVIGESARRENFSLYGYAKDTNPLLAKVENLQFLKAISSATYTTAGVKSILSHEESNDLYEILPNYMNRTGVDVIWRTTNWGEPPVHIDKYENKESLQSKCTTNCAYDEVLLAGLKDEILKSTSNKVLIILHTSTSHGPTYSQKYPPQFEVFKPVCNSVELGECTQAELINAYDNTIVYTDYILNTLIEELKTLKDFKSSMIYISDHGESLGENNLYMHGVPMSFAPKQQYEIPFIVWTSTNKNIKQNDQFVQGNVFHSVLNLLGVESPIYQEHLNIFQ